MTFSLLRLNPLQGSGGDRNTREGDARDNDTRDRDIKERRKTRESFTRVRTLGMEKHQGDAKDIRHRAARSICVRYQASRAAPVWKCGHSCPGLVGTC